MIDYDSMSKWFLENIDLGPAEDAVMELMYEEFSGDK